MNTEFKGTPAPWHPVNYAGYIDLQTEPYYETGTNILKEDDFGEKAIYNAQLAASAPELLQMCIDTRQLLEPMTNNPASHIFMEQLNRIIEKALNPSNP